MGVRRNACFFHASAVRCTCHQPSAAHPSFDSLGLHSYPPPYIRNIHTLLSPPLCVLPYQLPTLTIYLTKLGKQCTFQLMIRTQLCDQQIDHVSYLLDCSVVYITCNLVHFFSWRFKYMYTTARHDVGIPCYMVQNSALSEYISYMELGILK